jgi:phosphoserine phosphatase
MRLVAFDFDGTLAPGEMFLPLADRAGVTDEVEELTEQAMNDEVSYAESLRYRASLLSDLTVEEVREAYAEVDLRPGAADIIRDLRAAGHHVAILTGGFDDCVEAVLDAAGVEVDTVVANHLEAVDGRLTGHVSGPLVDGTKDTALESLAADLDLGMERTVAVGDGANDLPMLEVAHLAIGFDPKRVVVPRCDVVVETIDELDAALEANGVLPHGR